MMCWKLLTFWIGAISSIRNPALGTQPSETKPIGILFFGSMVAWEPGDECQSLPVCVRQWGTDSRNQMDYTEDTIPQTLIQNKKFINCNYLFLSTFHVPQYLSWTRIRFASQIPGNCIQSISCIALFVCWQGFSICFKHTCYHEFYKYDEIMEFGNCFNDKFNLWVRIISCTLFFQWKAFCLKETCHSTYWQVFEVTMYLWCHW